MKRGQSNSLSARKRYFTEVHRDSLLEMYTVHRNKEGTNLAALLLKHFEITPEKFTDLVSSLLSPLESSPPTKPKAQNLKLLELQHRHRAIAHFQDALNTSLIQFNDRFQYLQTLARVHIILELDKDNTGIGDLDDKTCTKIGELTAQRSKHPESIFVIHDQMPQVKEDLELSIIRAIETAKGKKEPGLIISGFAGDIPQTPENYFSFLKNLNCILNELERHHNFPIFLLWNEIDHHKDVEGTFGPNQRGQIIAERPHNITLIYNNPDSIAASLDALILRLAPLMRNSDATPPTSLEEIEELKGGPLDDLGQEVFAYAVKSPSQEEILEIAMQSHRFSDLCELIKRIPLAAGLLGRDTINDLHWQQDLAVDALRQMHESRQRNEQRTYRTILDPENKLSDEKLLEATEEYLDGLKTALDHCQRIEREIEGRTPQQQEILRICYVDLCEENIPISFKQLKEALNNGLSRNGAARVLATILERELVEDKNKEKQPCLLACVIRTNVDGPFRVVGRSPLANGQQINAALLPEIINPFQADKSSVGNKGPLAAGNFQPEDGLDWMGAVEKKIDEILTIYTQVV